MAMRFFGGFFSEERGSHGDLMESLFSDLLHFREYADAGWVRLEGRRIQC